MWSWFRLSCTYPKPHAAPHCVAIPPPPPHHAPHSLPPPYQSRNPKRGVAAPKPTRREETLRSVLRSSGALRSLCWLLLHRRDNVSDGAAAILFALVSSPDARPVAATAEWVPSLIEQGCVPVLKMAAGRQPRRPRQLPVTSERRSDAPRAGTTIAGKPEVPPLSSNVVTAVSAAMRPRGTPHLLGESSAALRTAEPWCFRGLEGERGCGQDANGAAPSDKGWGRGMGTQGGGGTMESVNDDPGEAARYLMEFLSREACTRYFDMLARSVRESGSRELRANVAIALVILSTESGEGYAFEVRSHRLGIVARDAALPNQSISFLDICLPQGKTAHLERCQRQQQADTLQPNPRAVRPMLIKCIASPPHSHPCSVSKAMRDQWSNDRGRQPMSSPPPHPILGNRW